MFWKFEWEAALHLWILEKALLMAEEKNPKMKISTPGMISASSISSSAATSGHFPNFIFSLQIQQIEINQTPSPAPAIFPAAAQFWGKKD